MNLSSICRATAAIALMSLSLAATAKIDLPSRLGMHRTPYARGGDDTCISAILRLDTKTDISVIKDAGFTPDIFRPGIALVSIPSSRLSELCAIDEVLSISYGRVRVHPTMDHARKSAGVDKIHSGIDVVSGKSYSGRGVIVGLMDQGMDPNHINFLDKNGESRFSVIWTFLDTDGSYTEYSDNAVSDFTTEMPQSFHGTYTCGILAGSYSGAGMSAFSDKEGNCAVSECDIPYHGVAPDVEIVAGCGVLSDANIITAIENIIQYAKSQGKTPVINLSIGSTGGSFDLADPLCAYLNEAGREDAIIIAAAGNDGHKRMSLSRRFDTDTDRPLLTFLDGLEALSDSDPSDYFIEVWGDDRSYPDIDIVMHDRITGVTTTLYSFPDQYIEQTVIGTNEGHTQPDYILSEELAAHFTGNIIVGREVNTVNQQSHTIIMTSINQLQYDNRTVIGLKIRGKAGHRMHMTTDGNLQLSSFDIDGAENGNPDLSISSLVCGDNIISVGAHVTRTGNGCLDGNTHSIFNYFYPAECGAAAYFSSYAVLPDGRTYPTITAPGNEVISSYSRYYTAKLSENELGSYTAYATDIEGERHYWQTECGTSASAPFVAGTVATWLEADPSLTPGEIKDILCRTATSDSFSQNIDTPARFGYGKAGSLAGLNEVISRKTATEGIMAETDCITIYGKEKRYTISVFGAEYIRAELYDISGRRIAYHKADSEYLLADYSECPTGIYILSVAAGSDFHNPAVCNTYKIALI